ITSLRLLRGALSHLDRHHARDAVDAEHRLQGDVGHRYVPGFFSSSWSMITQSTGPPVRVLYVIRPSGATVQPSSGRCALYRAANSSAEGASKPWYVFMTSRTSRPGLPRRPLRRRLAFGARRACEPFRITVGSNIESLKVGEKRHRTRLPGRDGSRST